MKVQNIDIVLIHVATCGDSSWGIDPRYSRA